ncbi:MAG: hypothetical protein WCW17_01865 [Patescibacteria group bacterium]
MLNKDLNKIKSFGLIEVMLSVSIFVILLTGITGLTQKTMSASTRTIERQYALGLAQEGIEVILHKGVDGLPAAESFHDYEWLGYVEFVDGSWILKDNDNMVNDDPCGFDENKVHLDDVDWMCAEDFVSPYGDDSTRFSRIINIKKDAASTEFIITVKVAWDTIIPDEASSIDPKNSVILSTILVSGGLSGGDLIPPAFPIGSIINVANPWGSTDFVRLPLVLTWPSAVDNSGGSGVAYYKISATGVGYGCGGDDEYQEAINFPNEGEIVDVQTATIEYSYLSGRFWENTCGGDTDFINLTITAYDGANNPSKSLIIPEGRLSGIIY